MPDATVASGPDSVLWDIVEDHFDELEFCVERFDWTLNDPRQDLERLSSGIEKRLLAHLDGMVVGGHAVIEQLLEPALADLTPTEPARATALALVLVANGLFDPMSVGLGHEAPEVRRAFVRAAGLFESPRLQQWARDRLRSTTRSEEQAALIDLLARGGLENPVIAWALRHPVSSVVAAGARAARYGDSHALLGDVEVLLDSPERLVRDAALLTCLASGSASAWATCERLAIDPENSHAEAMALYAALGSTAHHDRLAQQVSRQTHRAHALFALGFSGNPRQVPFLLEHVAGPDEVLAKIAAQAVSTITGLDLSNGTFSAKNAGAEPKDGEDAALPALDDEPDDLLPMPEESLPDLDPTAVAGHWADAKDAFQPETRYLGGRPFGPKTALDYLEGSPLRRRHVIALAVAIRSGGRAWIDTRATTRMQRSQIARIRALDAAGLFRQFVGW